MKSRIIVFSLLLIVFSVWRMTGGGDQFIGAVASDMKERLSQFKPGARAASAATGKVKAYYPSDTAVVSLGANADTRESWPVPKIKGVNGHNYGADTTMDNYYPDYR